MSSGFDIDSQKFKEFCWQTATLYVELSPWYPMCQSLHKVLMHGHDIIDYFTLPLSMTSEDAQEA